MKQEAPDMIFIQETKCSIQKIKEIYSKWLNRFEFLEVKGENIARGILTLWNPLKIGIIDAEASRNYLSVVIQPVGDMDTYLVTNVYGPQRMDEKLRFLDSLMDLRERYVEMPWIMGGDFNMIKSLSEKKGGTRTLNKYSLAFQTFLDTMKLVDIDLSNGLFTWNNRRGGEYLVASKLKHIKLRLKDWNKNEFGNIFEEKKAIENKLQVLNQTLIKDGFDKVSNDKATKFQQDWENLCKEEEIFWRQKPRVQWLKERERNTIFFHRSTLANRAHNRISSIKDEGGQLLSAHEEIQVVLVQRFCGIVNETISNRDPFIKDLTRHIPRLVSREGNFNLNRPVTEEEISEVLKEMQNGKALGPDSFNVDFFKTCWNIVKQDILNVVEDSKRNITILKALNTSFISMIPKQDNALTPDKFRPIALCNVVYNIISKVAANRLKPLLPTLVPAEQSSYVEGRQILNNIIQA
eukprot:PITA_05056